MNFKKRKVKVICNQKMTSNLRIKGVVKTATTVKNILSMGIKAEEVGKFKQYIKTNLKAIDDIYQADIQDCHVQ